jgi:hypothetical protein
MRARQVSTYGEAKDLLGPAPGLGVQSYKQEGRKLKAATW